ncbi:MAG: trigger factor [Candidatus Moranbacteria bacterium]|nr:trigger factor [Candidatus Moranbacteria bacterium]
MEIKKLPKSKIEFKINIAWENWKNFLDEAVSEISKDLKIQGFRPGKAPKNIVEQKVGKDAILNAAAESAIRKNYSKEVEKLNLEIIGSPQISISKLAEGNDLEFIVVSSVMPEISLKDWQEGVKKINAKFKAEKTEVPEEDIAKELEKLAKSRAKLVTVKRVAKKDDAVVLDFEVKRDGVVIEGGSAKDHNLILGSNVFIPGFEEHIINMKEGEEKTFELAFPENYHEKNLAGKKAQFEVKLKLVQEREIPSVDDDFAKSLGEFNNLSDLKKNIKEGLEKEKEFHKKEDQRGEIVESLVKKISLEGDLPEILIDEEIHKMLGELESQIQQMGMNMEDYLKQMGKTAEDLKKDWQPQALKRIKAALSLEEIGKEKEIEIPAESIEEAMNKTLQYYKNIKDIEKKIDMKRLYDYTRSMLRNEEIFKLLEKM